MWGQLALVAKRVFQSELLVLLGDDIEMRPTAWVDLISGRILTTGVCKCHCMVSSCSYMCAKQTSQVVAA